MCGRFPGLRGWWIEEAAPQTRPVLEGTRPALVERILGVPLGGVADDHVVGVEVGAIVELHAVAQGAGPDRRVGVGLALGGERRNGLGSTDLVAVQRLG